MCKDLQKIKIKKMKFHEEIDQFIEQFKGQIIGQHSQYLHNRKTMFMNRGGHDLKTTNYGEDFTFCNPELTSETCASYPAHDPSLFTQFINKLFIYNS